MSTDRPRMPELDRTSAQRTPFTGPPNDMLGQSINNMYRLVMPWANQGAASARNWQANMMKGPAAGPGNAGGPGGSGPNQAKFMQAMNQFMNAYMQFVQAWFNLMQAYSETPTAMNWTPAAPPPSGSPGPQPGTGTAAEPGTAQGTENIAFRVDSSRSVLVHGSVDSQARAYPLTAADTMDTAGLTIEFEPVILYGDRPITAVVTVTDELPAGTYTSRLLNPRGDNFGSLTIQVE